MTNLANSRDRHPHWTAGRKLAPALLAAAVGLLPAAASAHHSHAMFDPSKTLTVQGTVKKFLYSNPHMWLFLAVMDGKGQEVEFPIEGTNIQAAGRMGITSSTFKPGDKVSLLINPYRDGRPGGSWREVTDARGVLHKPERD
jgi:hypothetical protein